MLQQLTCNTPFLIPPLLFNQIRDSPIFELSNPPFGADKTRDLLKPKNLIFEKKVEIWTEKSKDVVSHLRFFEWVVEWYSN